MQYKLGVPLTAFVAAACAAFFFLKKPDALSEISPVGSVSPDSGEATQPRAFASIINAKSGKPESPQLPVLAPQSLNSSEGFGSINAASLPLPNQPQGQVDRENFARHQGIGSRPQYDGPMASQLNEDSIQCVGLEESQRSLSQIAAASTPDAINDVKDLNFYEACMRSRGWKF
jgi:hypothetical protein